MRAIANPKVAQQFMNLDIEPTATQPREFAALIRGDMEKWAKLIKAAKIPVD